MKSLSEYQSLFEDYQKKKWELKEPYNLYKPVEHILSIAGKRMRPALVLIGYHIFDDSIEVALPVALAVEIFHNFTLVHDDIMDAAPLRRGVPTVHTRFGINAAILSGDVMLIQAYEHLISTPISAARLKSVITTFNNAAIKVCEGQQWDMDFESQNHVTESQYIEMIGHKTAALVGAALELGALAAPQSTQTDANALYQFGYNVGVAFQIHDDILDSFGDPVTFGKKVGGDIAQNKKTLLVIDAMNMGSETQREDLRRLMSPENYVTEREKIERV